MDPESIKNIPSYLVLAYNILWDLEMDGSIPATHGDELPTYVLLDLRAYERPAALGEDGLLEVVMNLLSDMHDYSIKDVKIKVIEE